MNRASYSLLFAGDKMLLTQHEDVIYDENINRGYRKSGLNVYINNIVRKKSDIF
jgi:hypothetical protein